MYIPWLFVMISVVLYVTYSQNLKKSMDCDYEAQYIALKTKLRKRTESIDL